MIAPDAGRQGVSGDEAMLSIVEEARDALVARGQARADQFNR